MLSGLISLFVLCLIGGGDITLNSNRNMVQAEAILNEKICILFLNEEVKPYTSFILN